VPFGCLASCLEIKVQILERAFRKGFELTARLATDAQHLLFHTS
jgi:hypothetical protein